MKQKIQLTESQLRKLIKESVLAELDKRKVMPSKYYEIFKNRVINASHGRFGDVDKAVIEFYKDFKKRVPNEDFTLENLMDLAEKISDGGFSTHERGGMLGGHKVKDAQGWWGKNAGKFLEEKKVKVTEGQLRKLIKESVKKALVKEWRELTASEKEWRDIEQEREDKKHAKENDDAVKKSKFAKKMLGKKSGELNEISSDMIGKARDKFIQKYGNNYMGQETPGEMDSQLKTDRFKRKLHPKDNRPLAWHQADFDRAYEKAKMDENPEIIKKAEELVHKVKHWSVEEITDRLDSYTSEANVYGEAQDENGEWWGFWAGGTVDCGEVVDVAYDEDIKFEAPNGFTGWC